MVMTAIERRVMTTASVAVDGPPPAPLGRREMRIGCPSLPPPSASTAPSHIILGMGTALV
jgi:hypothetical protein